MTGARYLGTELEPIDTSMIQVAGATQGLHEALQGLSGRMYGSDTRQTQQEQGTSHLHPTRQTGGAAEMVRDE